MHIRRKNPWPSGPTLGLACNFDAPARSLSSTPKVMGGCCSRLTGRRRTGSKTRRAAAAERAAAGSAYRQVFTRANRPTRMVTAFNALAMRERGRGFAGCRSTPGHPGRGPGALAGRTAAGRGGRRWRHAGTGCTPGRRGTTSASRIARRVTSIYPSPAWVYDAAGGATGSGVIAPDELRSGRPDQHAAPAGRARVDERGGRGDFYHCSKSRNYHEL